MAVPKKILDLVDLFQGNAAAYQSAHYNEAQTRQEFINPLFECLGWDMDNKQGHAEAYKDVIHEDAIKVGGATKAPDYCFRVGGTRKFFLEAKKPAVNVKDDPNPAYQLRRYAWSAKLPLSVLTNFKELAVYDCRLKPAQTDKASAARTLVYTCTDYAARWDEIVGVFSRDAILKGSFDKYAEKNKGKRGTATVDAAFLLEIEAWRDALAKNLALRNPELSQRELNYAVQVTIDRVIFLRMCEDRGIERYGALLALLNGPAVYERLKQLFQNADARYNSGLFHFHKEKDQAEPPDELTPCLTIDDKPLKEIIKGIYYPDSPYEFSVLPAEILGQVYEQFLGKVIRLTAGHQAKVEDKPEVKKAGGIYYTPTDIVNYIVKHTVGKLLEGKTPKQVAKLRILDPACGSGSFLLGAYQHLLDWHRDWYVADGPENHKKGLYQASAGWGLATSEKKRILLNNIYGVDIDPQAVEVTKLSLLLKVLEGESQETLDRQLGLFHERALPDLASNIRCGNSLIGPDFFEHLQITLFEEEERYRINAFEWNKVFPHILKAGGFTAIIGNPPWGQKEVDDALAVKRYLWEVFPSTRGIYDIFRPFVEQCIRLLSDGGLFGLVLPDIVLLKDYSETRRYLLERLTLTRIDWWGMAFVSAVIDAATIVGAKRSAPKDHRVRACVRDPEQPLDHEIPQADFWTNPRLIFNLHLTPEKRQVLEKLASCPSLGAYFEVHEGVHSGNIRKELFVSTNVDGTCRELYFGRGEIAPYHMEWQGKYIRLAALPKTRSRLCYANLGKADWHEREKVLVRRTGDYVLAAFDSACRYASNNFFLVFSRQLCSLDLAGLCALLNSRLMTWYFRTIEPRRGRVFAELKIKHLTAFPLPVAILQPEGCKALNDLGAQRAGVATELVDVATPHDYTVLQRQASYLESTIEGLVRDLFGLPRHFNGSFGTEEEMSHATIDYEPRPPHQEAMPSR
jgi:hypothetical protein